MHVRWYRISEDHKATTTFTDFFAPNGQLIAAGNAYTGKAILGVKQTLLPPNGNKVWWHLIEDATFIGEDAKSQTVSAKITIQTIYHPGNCSQAQ